MNNKICLICKKKFNLTHGNQKLCSDECKQKRKNIVNLKFLPTKENRKKYRIKYREHHRNYIQKYRKNINHRIADYLRTRIKIVLKENIKSSITFNLVGCTVEFLKYYLESKFSPGMNWNNYSKFGWHIDHIKPCASFDLSKPSEQRKCFCYTNLQPLWAEENWSKNCKY